MAAPLQSGELFQDWRAFWPAPGSTLQDAAPSNRGCECETFWWKWGRRTAPKARCTSRKNFWYRVNHLLLSLCRFHAAQLGRRKGVVVTADAGAMEASSQH